MVVGQERRQVVTACLGHISPPSLPSPVTVPGEVLPHPRATLGAPNTFRFADKCRRDDSTTSACPFPGGCPRPAGSLGLAPLPSPPAAGNREGLLRQRLGSSLPQRGSRGSSPGRPLLHGRQRRPPPLAALRVPLPRPNVGASWASWRTRASPPLLRSSGSRLPHPQLLSRGRAP